MIIKDAFNVAKRAWSVRLILLAAVLEGAGAVLPLFTPHQPPVWLGALNFFVVMSALIARFVAQPKMHDNG